MTSRQAGFTLLEILAALVVLGFLMLGLAQGTRFGLRTWAMQTRMIEQHDAIDAIDRPIRGLVAHMDPGTPTRDHTLRGGPSRVVFTSELPMAAAGLASRRANMLLSVNAAHDLVLIWLPHLHAERFGPAPPMQTAVLLHNVARIALAYWQRGGGWRSAWTGRHLPDLIRLRIVFRGGDHRDWPDIVAAPMLDPDGD